MPENAKYANVKMPAAFLTPHEFTAKDGRTFEKAYVHFPEGTKVDVYKRQAIAPPVMTPCSWCCAMWIAMTCPLSWPCGPMGAVITRPVSYTHLPLQIRLQYHQRGSG